METVKAPISTYGSFGIMMDKKYIFLPTDKDSIKICLTAEDRKYWLIVDIKPCTKVSSSLSSYKLLTPKGEVPSSVSSELMGGFTAITAIVNAYGLSIRELKAKIADSLSKAGYTQEEYKGEGIEYG